jgi:hypothetical protein
MTMTAANKALADSRPSMESDMVDERSPVVVSTKLERTSHLKVRYEHKGLIERPSITLICVENRK